MNKKRGFLSGFVFSIMLVCASLMSLRYPPQFEKTLRGALPVNAVIWDLQGRTEYVLFYQGRKGVIVGSQEWPFTDEGFSCPIDYKQNLTDNLLYIFRTKQALADKNVRLLVTLAPEKARLFPQYLGTNALPPCRTGPYAVIRTALVKKGVAAKAVNLADAEALFSHAARRREVMLLSRQISPSGNLQLLVIPAHFSKT